MKCRARNLVFVLLSQGPWAFTFTHFQAIFALTREMPEAEYIKQHMGILEKKKHKAKDEKEEENS